jgi:hydrogenase maturation protein HypF
MRSTLTDLDQRRVVVTLSGVVQGLGVRPAIARLAAAEGLAGEVRNDAGGVGVDAQGAPAHVARFLASLAGALPEGARVLSITIEDVAPGAAGPFRIAPPQDDGPRRDSLAPDLGACAACLAEVRDRGARRYRYPFTTCSACGPRWTCRRRCARTPRPRGTDTPAGDR